MTMMVLDGYLLKKYFLALQNACVQFSGVATVVINKSVRNLKSSIIIFLHFQLKIIQVNIISVRRCHNFGNYDNSDGKQQCCQCF